MKIRTALTLKNTLATAAVFLACLAAVYLVSEHTRSRTFYHTLQSEAVTKAHLFLQGRGDARTMQEIYLNNRNFIDEVEVAVYSADARMLYHDAIRSDIVKEDLAMIARIRDLHRIEKIEDRIEALEDQVLAHELDDFSAPMTALRKETMAWFRYYSQLDDVACELRENENGFFTDSEQLLFHMFEDRVIRLREESQLLRESCAQLQSLFQAEIDTRQNHIMQILTIVTTIFLPLTLLVGWYGMNFVGMPELTWKYGYPVVVIVSIVTVGISLWVCKRKKFW